MNKKMIIYLIILAALAIIAAVYFLNKNKNSATNIQTTEEVTEQTTTQYGQKTSYSKKVKIQYPDFDLTFSGISEVPGPNGAKWSITTYDFVINKDNQSQKISWSSGAGSILPTPFSFNGKKYLLERIFSKSQGKLNENEIVISSTDPVSNTTTSNTKAVTVPISELLKNPEKYNNKKIKTTGFYSSGFERSLLFESEQAELSQGPAIWIATTNIKETNKKFDKPNSDRGYTATAEIEGMFKHDPNNTFGHVGFAHSQIE